jgi:hypothetical protein
MIAGPPGAKDEDRGERAGDLRPVGGAIREKGCLWARTAARRTERTARSAPRGGALLADACVQSIGPRRCYRADRSRLRPGVNDGLKHVMTEALWADIGWWELDHPDIDGCLNAAIVIGQAR